MKEATTVKFHRMFKHPSIANPDILLPLDTTVTPFGFIRNIFSQHGSNETDLMYLNSGKLQ